MLETDLLTKAFRAFDKEGKGFITEADLRRVLTSDLGERGVAGGELRAWLEGAAEYDREGQRVTYGSFVRMMNHTVKQRLQAGELIFSQGDPCVPPPPIPALAPAHDPSLPCPPMRSAGCDISTASSRARWTYCGLTALSRLRGG